MTRARMAVALAWLAAIIPGSAGSADAATYHVRKSGSDGNNGLSAATAFLTIGKAVSVAQPGDQVFIGAGTYAESISSARSGTDPKPILIQGDVNGSRTGDGGEIVIAGTGTFALRINGHRYIGISDLTFRGTTNPVLITQASHVWLADCRMENATADSVLVTSSRARLFNCTLTGGNGAGLRVTGDSSTVTLDRSIVDAVGGDGVYSSGGTSVISNCVLRVCGGWGLRHEKGTVTLTNSSIWSCAGGGIRSTSSVGTTTTTAWHNTIVDCGPYGAYVHAASLTFRNNIVAGVTAGLTRFGEGGNCTHSNNLYWNCNQNYSGVSAGTGDKNADPKFVNSVSDFRLQPGSPAIDAGANASSVTYFDHFLASRPSGGGYDIGFHERGPSLSAANTPYSNNFESPMGPEWSQSTRSSGAHFSNFAGRHGNNRLSLLLHTQPGRTYTVRFDLYTIDSWDGLNTDYTLGGPDSFNIAANGKCFFTHTFSWEWGYPVSYPKPPDQTGHLGFNSTWTDAIFRNVSATFRAESTTTQLDFYGRGLQAIDDESWGIDNLEVREGGIRIVRWREVSQTDL